MRLAIGAAVHSARAIAVGASLGQLSGDTTGRVLGEESRRELHPPASAGRGELCTDKNIKVDKNIKLQDAVFNITNKVAMRFYQYQKHPEIPEIGSMLSIRILLQLPAPIGRARHIG